MDTDELAAFGDALRKAAERHPGDFDKGLDEVGWREALVDDPAAAREVFAVQGELNLSSSALDDVLLHALGRTPDPDVAVVEWPARTGTRRLATATQVLVVQDRAAILAPHDSIGVRPVTGIDPEGGWMELDGFEVSLGSFAKEEGWERAAAAGRLAVATELAAASRAMLGLAREHAVTRVQFGKPISSFQAVRHRLADSLIAVTAAEAAVDAGWEEPTPYTASMAKAIAGRTARTVARHAQQVLAGMGFTTEHSFHRYFRRVLVLDQLLGSAVELSTAMGQQAIANRTIPEMLRL